MLMGLYIFGFWQDVVASTLFLGVPFFRLGNEASTMPSATTDSSSAVLVQDGSTHVTEQSVLRKTRVELRCGENETIAATEEMYGRALVVAEKFGIGTCFDRARDHGDEFCDGYIYPTLDNLEQVLDELDRAGVDYDNIDLPSTVHENSDLYRRLRRRYPIGVSVNLNGYGLP